MGWSSKYCSFVSGTLYATCGHLSVFNTGSHDHVQFFARSAHRSGWPQESINIQLWRIHGDSWIYRMMEFLWICDVILLVSQCRHNLVARNDSLCPAKVWYVLVFLFSIWGPFEFYIHEVGNRRGRCQHWSTRAIFGRADVQECYLEAGLLPN